MLFQQHAQRPSICAEAVLGKLCLVIMAMMTYGCGAAPRMVDAEGTLMVDQKPAPGATIMFFPKSSSARYVATGSTGVDGKFRLITDLKPGVPIGEYDVIVVWPDPATKPSGMDLMQGVPDDAPDLLQGKYAIRNESGLTAVIKKDTKEIPVLELTISQ